MQRRPATLVSMETGRASRTALRVASSACRAPVDGSSRGFLMIRLRCRCWGQGCSGTWNGRCTRWRATFATFMATRSRYAEDRLAEAVAHGVTQYVVLGAGLDTFAYRNPFPQVHVFEVDFPATQAWKRAMLEDAGIEAPPTLTFVPLDFEHQTLGRRTEFGGIRRRSAVIFRMAGCGAVSHARCVSGDAPNDRANAGRNRRVLRLCSGTGDTEPTAARDLRCAGGAGGAAGEPFQLFFTPQELEAELYAAGFQRLSKWVRQRAECALSSGSQPTDCGFPHEGLGMMATAWI